MTATCGGRRHGGHEAGLEGRGQFGGRQRHRVEPGLLVDFDRVVLAGPREQLLLLQVVGRGHRGLGEEVQPAAIRPVQDDVALLLHVGFEARPHLVEDVVHLLVGGEHHRDAERVHVLVNLRHANRGEHAALQRPHLHLAHDIGVVAGHAAGKEHDLHATVRDLAPLVRDFLQHLVPARAIGHERRHLDGDLRTGRRRGGQRQREYGKGREAGHDRSFESKVHTATPRTVRPSGQAATSRASARRGWPPATREPC